MKKIVLFLFCFSLFFLSGCEQKEENLLSGKHNIEITIKDHGVIKAQLDADAAPITVTNFIELAHEGFYDGLTFHRIIQGFMMQGGDGTSKGLEKPQIIGEFSANKHENPLKHTRGALSMARSTAYNSASTQFFIVQEDSDHLDGLYAVFGYVTEGMDIVDEICNNTPVTDDNGSVAEENQPIIEQIKVLD